MSWETHRFSVNIAKVALAEIQGKILSALDDQNEALGIVTEAVGREPATENGRTAFRLTAATGTALQQALAAINEAHAAMTAYGEQF